ncbi:LLM class flavin-dependent oxidoreductase [Arthrobacter sp. I2-34]|uniref:LLM class flavin-dependent oxidoreductase n=1 Tax=Arthrobacter hankyongi TaxID=2904801 RepID=A0ABS9L236_9MICC|nr:LLM class flavin-dependent oxidoreductase [Arthrobacter hankyongi]MCG2620660.1 LLM class flavin-dependent oxidoreductase [Arthrobacter hankyongi]
MTTDTSTNRPPAGRRLELGFLSFVHNTGRRTSPVDAARALQDGIGLFRRAEELGYDTGWVRNRHFEPFLSSPLVFLAAVSQRTSRLRLGTAVVPVRYEDPIRLAEDAANLDLLSGGRLELGLSSGYPAAVLEELFESGPPNGVADFRGEVQRRLGRLLAALRGEVLAVLDEPFSTLPAGDELTLTPPAPGLADRLWYGAGSLASAERAARQGFDLQVSTLNTEETGDPFEVRQAEQVRAYKKLLAELEPDRGPRVSVSRIMLPYLKDEDGAELQDWLKFYAGRMDEQGRPRTGASMRFSPAYHGDPEAILDALMADDALQEATQLVVTLPSLASPELHRRTLQLVTEHIAPQLGWSPAR